MSRIGELGIKFENLPAILGEYEKHLEPIEQYVALKGKSIEEANKEQAAWPIFYDQKKAELKIIAKYLEAHVNKKRGELFRNYTENYSRQLSDRAKDTYVDKDDEFLKIHELYLEVLELLEKYEAVTNAFVTRGYALKQIGEARVHQFHNTLI